MSRGSESRALALEVLAAVNHGGAYANLALPKALSASGLDSRDRGFVTELVYGSLRRQGELDTVVAAAAAKRPTTEIDHEVLDVLRLGVYQVLFLRVPGHAAVDESVNYAKSHALARASGFINGVLRSVTREHVEYWLKVIEANGGSEHSHPTWIAEEIEKALAENGDGAELADALEANNEPPLVCLTLLPGLSEHRESDEPTLFSPWGVTLPGGDPAADSRVAAGTARVQDEGSQLAALALIASAPVTSDTTFLDMCAGPGGKAAVLAAAALAHGAHVTAIETVPHRVRLVEDSVRALLARDSGVVKVLEGDSRVISGEFTRILLDAPCSGLGALRRRPEARWRKHPESLVELAALQSELLSAGLGALAPGGVLAYVTCSPVVAETTAIIEQALRSHPEISALDTAAVLDGATKSPIPRSSRGSAVQLWTHRHGTDAMFIQLLQKAVEL
jgi:16S rRNA (cytosine967-C5)-methyltransferase